MVEQKKPKISPSVTGLELLQDVERQCGFSIDSPDFPRFLDSHDRLSSLRDEFDIPGSVYFTNHALGPPPKETGRLLQEEVQAWTTMGTKGHVVHPFERPWVDTDVRKIEVLADIVGAQPSEVVLSSGLTTNLHMLLQAFYKPTAQRFKIIYEHDAFNSDRFALLSQVELAGLDPSTALVPVRTRKGEHTLRTEDILEAIDLHGSECALVMFGAVNWRTGQLLDVATITSHAKQRGCLVGWDLAHGVGCVEFELRRWDVDFAVWCSYKYLCGGPGATGGFFVHSKHSERARCSGWWGNALSSRFITVPDFRPREGAGGWVVSNPSVFGTVPLHASLSIFEKVLKLAGNQGDQTGESYGSNGEAAPTTRIMPILRSKGRLLTAYLEYLIEQAAAQRQGKMKVEIISPKAVDERGSTLALLIDDGTGTGAALNTVVGHLKDAGMIVDSRGSDLLRLSPSALMNTFEEARRLVNCIAEVL